MKTFALLCLLALPIPAADTTIVAKVVGVQDGGTLTLRLEDETLKVRLSGIDTLGLGQRDRDEWYAQQLANKIYLQARKHA